MNNFWVSFLVVIFYGVVHLHAAPEASARGVRTFKFEDTERKRPVVVEVWYPSDSLPVQPEEVRDAALSTRAKQYPLIIMSHGHRGDRREGSWLADQLVHSGYIVAAVDHYGNTNGTFNLLTTLKFWERPRDISFAIDQLIHEPLLKGRIDPERIGFVGYSLGGMTGLGLAGATVGALEQAIDAALGKHRDIKSEALAQIDMNEAKQPLKDSRIQAMLLICPANFAYQAESLGSIEIPIGFVGAVNDEVLPFKEHAYKIIKHLVPAKLKMMRKEISHYFFLNRNADSLCDRNSIHREVAVFAEDFFREFL